MSNEINIVNGSVTGVHLGAPIQDAIAEKPEDNKAHATERNTVTRISNSIETWDDQPVPSGGADVNAVIDELVANGQIGSGEPSKTYVWDGDQKNKVYVPYGDGIGFVKVSSDMPDLHNFEKIDTANGTFQPSDNNYVIIEGTAENGELFGAKGFAWIQSSANSPFAVVITDVLNSPIPSTGLYFVCAEIGNGDVQVFTNELVIAGTIKTIDPKYLPSGGGGGELPVIDLTELGADFSEVDLGSSTIVEIPFTDEIAAELIPKFTAQKPIVVKFLVQGYPLETILTPTNIYYESNDIFCSASGVNVTISDAQMYTLILDQQRLYFMIWVLANL